MIDSIYLLLARRRATIIIALTLLFIVVHLAGSAALGRGGRLMRGDARGYYIYLPSLVLDHDLDFRNDFARINEIPLDSPLLDETPLTETGKPGNMAPIGPAFFWAPFFLIGLVAQAAFNTVVGARPLWDGYGSVAQTSVAAAGIFYAGAAAALTARLIDRWYPPAVATGSALAVWLATPAVYYTVVSPAYSHTVGWFVIAAALLLWLRARQAPPETGPWPWVLVGLSFGVATMVRQQDMFFFAVPLLDLLWPGREPAMAARRRVVAGAALVGGFVLGFLPQMLAWKNLFGWYLGNPLTDQPQWLAPKLADSLIGLGSYGLLSWAPITVAGLVGLALFVRRLRPLGLGLLAAVALGIYFQSVVYVLIETGTTFGPRRSISAAAAFALGVAVLWSALIDPARSARRRPALPLALCTVLVAWNGLLLVGYQLMVHREGIYPSLRVLVHWLFTGEA